MLRPDATAAPASGLPRSRRLQGGSSHACHRSHHRERGCAAGEASVPCAREWRNVAAAKQVGVCASEIRRRRITRRVEAFASVLSPIEQAPRLLSQMSNARVQRGRERPHQ